jgi:hypothetical protein|tara:strand:+ start:3248 stop:3943 length:696 start_codon:yes stop_codon:yes gene_type:complete
MNFVKKIFEDDVDDEVHQQFQKFSRGEFKNRAIIKALNSKGKYSISTTAEFANELVKEVAKKLGEKKTNISGAVVSTSDLTGKLDFIDKKQFQGVKRYIIDNEMNGGEIIKLIEKFPKAFFALSFKTENTELKIKPKAPKSGKPGKGGEKPKANFCKLKTNDKNLGESFVFETENWRKAEISHEFIIEDIIFPEGEKDFSKIRELAKRKGKVIRKAEIDGKEVISEKDFVA